jgi:hypothetical protein
VLIGALHLGALWALAFVQPLLDLLGKNADFFVARHNTRGDILAFAIGFTVLPPLAMLVVEAIAERIRPTLRWGIHLLLIAALSAALLLQVLKDDFFSGPAGLLIVLAVALGIAIAAAYVRTRFVPSLLSVLSPAPVVFLAIFLLSSDVSKLVLPQEAVKAENVRVTARNPVVFVSFDELPVSSLMDSHGRIDAKAYPHFAELARQATWYRNNTSVADFTSRAIPAMLTGVNPGYSKLPIASDQPDNLFTLLGKTYRVRARETETELCPQSVCGGKTGVIAKGGEETEGSGSRIKDLWSDLSVVSEHLLLPNSLAAKLPAVDQTFSNFRTGGVDRPISAPNPRGHVARRGGNIATAAGETREQIFDQFLASIDTHLRSLYFIYWNIPHFPWQYLPTGQQYPLSPSTDREAFRTGTADLRWTHDRYLVDHALQRHLLQTGYADELLGRLIAKLKRLGIWGRAVVVVTADHGIAFEPGEYRRISDEANLAETTSVPLLIKEPGQHRGRVVNVHSCDTDILLRIARALKVKVPWQTDSCPSDEVRVDNKLGRRLTMPLDEYVRQRDAKVTRNARLFGSDEGLDARFRWGPNKALIGKRVSAVASQPPSGAHAELEHADRYGSVDPTSTSVPVLLQGTISGTGGGEPLAVAVNGRVEAVGQTYDLGNEARFLTMIPPSSLVRGPNQVEIYRVHRGSGRLRLEPLGGTPGG